MTRLAQELGATPRRGMAVTLASSGVDCGEPRPVLVGQREPQLLVGLDLALPGWPELS